MPDASVPSSTAKYWNRGTFSAMHVPICSPARTNTCLFIAVSHVERTRLDGSICRCYKGSTFSQWELASECLLSVAGRKRVGHAWIAVVRAVSHDKDAPPPSWRSSIHSGIAHEIGSDGAKTSEHRKEPRFLCLFHHHPRAVAGANRRSAALFHCGDQQVQAVSLQQFADEPARP
jgi:hypothetical protein